MLRRGSRRSKNTQEKWQKQICPSVWSSAVRKIKTCLTLRSVLLDPFARVAIYYQKDTQGHKETARVQETYTWVLLMVVCRAVSCLASCSLLISLCILVKMNANPDKKPGERFYKYVRF